MEIAFVGSLRLGVLLDRHKQYVLTLSVLLLATVVSLSALGERSLEVYLSLFAVSYFASTALFRPRRITFDFVGAALFVVFCFIVFQKVMAILS